MSRRNRTYNEMAAPGTIEGTSFVNIKIKWIADQLNSVARFQWMKPTASMNNSLPTMTKNHFLKEKQTMEWNVRTCGLNRKLESF